MLLPFLAAGLASPFLGRSRIDRLGSAAREASGDMNAHAVDSVQGLGEIVAFQGTAARGAAFTALARQYAEARLPFLRDLTLQASWQEMATGAGGLAVVGTGAALAASGRLDAGLLPLLTLLAMSAFVPVSEIAQIGRQLADTLGAARRLHAIHAEPVPVRDGPGVPSGAGDGPAGALAVEVGRQLHLSRARRARAARLSRFGFRGDHGRPRRPLGRGQDHDGRAAPALLGSGSRHGADRAPMRATTSSTICAAASRWSPRTPISSTTPCAPTS